MSDLSNCCGFLWDKHNADKIWAKHAVSPSECEQTFFNRPFIVAEDLKHSRQEQRYFALGQTHSGRELYLVFTVRETLIRCISVRDMSREERKVYAQS